MNFVKVWLKAPGGAEVFLNIARIDRVWSYSLNGVDYIGITAAGEVYFMSLSGFGTVENFVQLLGMYHGTPEEEEHEV